MLKRDVRRDGHLVRNALHPSYWISGTFLIVKRISLARHANRISSWRRHQDDKAFKKMQ